MKKLTEARPQAGSAPRLSKTAIIVMMLRRPNGATLNQLADATGWKVRSIRGAISARVKQKKLMTVVSEVIDGVRFYRIEN